MSSDTKREHAFMVTVDSSYGVVKIHAYIWEVKNGELDQGYADLYVTQFADNAKPTGAYVEYGTVHSIDMARAERMVKTLRTITRGLDKLRSSEGYLTDTDLPALLFRVARTLKIKSFYVRNTREARERSGERWRKADAGSVQAWYSMALENIKQGKSSTYN